MHNPECTLEHNHKQWRIQTRRLEGAVTYGGPKNLHLFKYPWFSMTIVGYHTNVFTFCRLKKWLCLLVERCDLSWNHNSLKSLCIIIHKKFEAGPRRWALFFTSYR